MHRRLEHFGRQGEIGDDADFPRLRAQFESEVTDEMREVGYVPVLDLGTFWDTVYNEEKNKYKFELSIHGYYVGRRKAWLIEGMSGGRTILRNTPPDKSKPSSKKST